MYCPMGGRGYAGREKNDRSTRRRSDLIVLNKKLISSSSKKGLSPSYVLIYSKHDSESGTDDDERGEERREREEEVAMAQIRVGMIRDRGGVKGAPSPLKIAAATRQLLPQSRTPHPIIIPLGPPILRK